MEVVTACYMLCQMFRCAQHCINAIEKAFILMLGVMLNTRKVISTIITMSE